MQLRWDHARPAAGAEGRKTKPNRSHNEQGLEVKNALSPSGRGRKMSLTFPLIEQAIGVKVCFWFLFQRASLLLLLGLRRTLFSTGFLFALLVSSLRARGSASSVCALSRAPCEELCFPLTKTYMAVGNPEICREQARCV